MKSISNKMYGYINLGLIAIYFCLFIKSLIDGRCTERIDEKEIFSSYLLINNLIFAIILVGLLSLITFIFYKLKLSYSYRVFAVIIGVFMIYMPFQDGYLIWSDWYALLEIEIGFAAVILFSIILIMGLIIRRLSRKFEQN